MLKIGKTIEEFQAKTNKNNLTLRCLASITKTVNQKKYLLLWLLAFTVQLAFSQDPYSSKEFRFLAYEKIPAWTCVASDWDSESPVINLYNHEKYKGHADFVSKGLQTGITFKQFKAQVSHFKTRKYLPFFLFDFREAPINYKGETYTWAIRVEDYSYSDNADEMGETVLRLLELVNLHVAKHGKEKGRGLLVLATSERARPNTKIAPLINKNGFSNLILSELIKLAGAPALKVLNEGIGFGYLRYVKAEEEDTLVSNYSDILIYEKLPARVPPVSGIITLEAQTPLSHVNLLAKNRGTFNMYTLKLEHIPNLEKYMGQLVKVQCLKKGISITPANKLTATSFWYDMKSLKVVLPEPDFSVHEIVSLNGTDSSATRHNIVGAKAGNYAILRRNFPNSVRKGFAIPFSYYATLIKNCEAQTLISSLLNKKKNISRKERDTLLQKIQQSILLTSLPPGLIHEMRALITKEYPNTRIRLRSSTNCEDLPNFNGAGLYLSKGFNTIENDFILEQKLLNVYASLWTPLAFNEREFYNIDHQKAAMAVLINEAFSNEYANGVVLTIPIKTGYSMLINSQKGENSVTNPKSGQIPESIVYSSSLNNNYSVETKSNIGNIFIENEDNSNSSANFTQKLKELRELAKSVHHIITKHAPTVKDQRFGVDIEFKIVKKGTYYKIYVKQARLLGSTLPD
jgi:hypothetical protein